MDKVRDSSFQRFLNGYRFVALILLNTLVGFLLLNAAISVAFLVKDHFSVNPVTSKYGRSITKPLYPYLSENEVDELLKETWSRQYDFEPFTQFKEGPSRGLFVNVDEHGFRISKNQGPWPPQASSLNIFLFGGSTTFGYGVPDDQTVASHLQEALTKSLGRDVRVYNFGRGHYYLTQERILFESLLTFGIAPDVAIFVDGMNDCYRHDNEPENSDQLRAFVSNKHPLATLRALMPETSFGRAARGFGDKLFTGQKSSSESGNRNDAAIDSRKYGDPAVITRVIQRYQADKRLIEAVAGSFGVKTVFVWQPSPTYHYDQQFHPFTQGGYGDHGYSKYGYEHMASLIREKPPGRNFLWCADIQENLKEPLYIDKLHYSADFSKRFAGVIAKMLIERGMLSSVR